MTDFNEMFAGINPAVVRAVLEAVKAESVAGDYDGMPRLNLVPAAEVRKRSAERRCRNAAAGK